MKYNDNGEYKEIVVKSTDTLPVGTEVDFDGNEVPSGWTEVDNVLYSNPSGSNGSITLSKSANNYKYLEIYYSNTSGGNQRMSMQKFDTTLGSTKCALFIITADSGGAMYLTNRDVNISGTTISTLDNTRYSKGVINFSGGGIVATTPVNEIFIYKVVGYKE